MPIYYNGVQITNVTGIDVDVNNIQVTSFIYTLGRDDEHVPINASGVRTHGFQSVKLSDTTYKIQTSEGEDLTEEQSATFLRKLIGSGHVPQYEPIKPHYSYIIEGEGDAIYQIMFVVNDGLTFQKVATIGGGSSTAEEVSYNNSASGLGAQNVQDAIDELVDYIDNIFATINTTEFGGN